MYNCIRYLPVVKGQLAKGLALGMCTEICFKAKRVNYWQESLDSVKRGAGPWSIVGDMSTAKAEEISK